MRAFSYALEEALASLWRGRQSGLLSTATIALALLFLGGFLLVTTNLDRLLARLGASAEMSVYLKDDVSQGERTEIERLLDGSGVAAGREFVTKAEALTRFKRTFGSLPAALEGLEENPLPASLEVRIRPDAPASAQVEAVLAQLRETAGVADVRYDRQWIDRLLAAATVIRGVGFGLSVLLTLAAALTVANVVRLALFARHDEIDIMRLVGAPAVYIRGPFVMEGILQGGIGAFAALALLWAGFLVVRVRYLPRLSTVLDVSTATFLPWSLAGLLVAGGMVVGCLGGLVASWRPGDWAARRE